MNNLNRLQWPLIIGMAALALIRPFLSITGLMDSLGRPTGPLLVTALLSVVWVAIAAFGSVRQPVLTLTFTGLAYGVFAIVISAILSPASIWRLVDRLIDVRPCMVSLPGTPGCS